MDRHSGTHPTEAVPVDPAPEWPPPAGGTELEVPMWQLGLGAGPESYPMRPDASDCIYYLRTGLCGYGNRCRFNHPYDRIMAREVAKAGGGDHPQRPDDPVCKYYMRTGMCRYGAACKYHHPKYETESLAPVTLNTFGYPLREGAQECSFYAKNGQCKFGGTCRFHHPQPAGVYPRGLSPSAQPCQQYGIIQANWPVASPAMFTGSYVQGSYGPVLLSPAVFPVPGWSAYVAPVAHVASPSTQPRPIYGVSQLSPSATPYTGSYVSMTSSVGPSSSSKKEDAFPERPGMPECQHFMKTGHCKFGGACKYHHPTERSAEKTNFVLNPVGLPLRPGMQLCPRYAQSGVCVFGTLCKFDHPMGTLSYSVSASSLTDVPVVPYPAGSANVTVAPSSSSAELKPDLFPVLGKCEGEVQTSR